MIFEDAIQSVSGTSTLVPLYWLCGEDIDRREGRWNFEPSVPNSAYASDY